jgi:hypothetical protein
MSGGLFGSGAVDWPTIVRLAVVVAAAIAVRHLVLRFGTKAIDRRRDKDRRGGDKRSR